MAAAGKFESVAGIEKYRDRIHTSRQNLRSLPEDLQRRVLLIEADCNDEDLSDSLQALQGWHLLLFCNNVAFPAGLNKRFVAFCSKDKSKCLHVESPVREVSKLLVCRLAGNLRRLMDVWPLSICLVSALPLDALASTYSQNLPFQTSWNTLHIANVYLHPTA